MSRVGLAPAALISRFLAELRVHQNRQMFFAPTRPRENPTEMLPADHGINLCDPAARPTRKQPEFVEANRSSRGPDPRSTTLSAGTWLGR